MGPGASWPFRPFPIKKEDRDGIGTLKPIHAKTEEEKRKKERKMKKGKSERKGEEEK